MTQTYAARIAKRPAYARYKNRKKTIRQGVKAGRFSDEQARELMREARARYFADQTWPTQTSKAIKAGEAWCSVNPDHPAAMDVRDGSCHDLCVGAEGRTCNCWCEGRNHGLANGPQRFTPFASKKQRTWVDDALYAPRRQATIWCSRGEISGAERMALIAALETEIMRLGRPLRDHKRWMTDWLNDRDDERT